MREERIKLKCGLNDDMLLARDIIPFFKSQQFDPEKEYFEFSISGKIAPDDIKSFLILPYEIALTEYNDGVILSTGTEHWMGSEEGYRHRKDHSKLSLHTHPQYGRKVFVTTPSFLDVYITDFVSRHTILALAHAEGIMIYQKPVINPNTGESCRDMEARDIMLIYGKKRGIDTFLLGKGRSNLKHFSELSEEEKVKFQRQFAEDTGMIINEALWDDKSEIEQIVSKIFAFRNKDE